MVQMGEFSSFVPLENKSTECKLADSTDRPFLL
jgi:hypothetical protein